jgi:hypothetical protein
MMVMTMPVAVAAAAVAVVVVALRVISSGDGGGASSSGGGGDSGAMPTAAATNRMMALTHSTSTEHGSMRNAGRYETATFAGLMGVKDCVRVAHAIAVQQLHTNDQGHTDSIVCRVP